MVKCNINGRDQSDCVTSGAIPREQRDTINMISDTSASKQFSGEMGERVKKHTPIDGKRVVLVLLIVLLLSLLYLWFCVVMVMLVVVVVVVVLVAVFQAVVVVVVAVVMLVFMVVLVMVIGNDGGGNDDVGCVSDGTGGGSDGW